MLKTTAHALILITGLSFRAFAGSVNTEPVGGFSSNGLAPTALTFSLGSNQIFGSNGSGASAVRDYVTFTVPGNLVVTALTMLNTSPIGNIGFIGLQAGNQVTLLPSASTAAGLLGWKHYLPTDINTDILPFMSVPNTASSAFTIPLPPGNYSLWIQDSSPGTFNYGFDVQLTPAPEPGTWATSLAVVTGVILLLRLRRRSATQ